MILEYKVSNSKYNIVKDVLIKEFNLSKRLITKLKQENRIYVNGNSCFVNYSLKENDIVKVNLCFNENCDNIVATKMPLDIIYEDEFLIILNKQPKIETHPTVLNNTKTLSNGLKYYYDTINLKRKIRPVNRLDKDTSGLIVFAKNQYIQEELVKQMKDKTFIKEYIAVVEGNVEKEQGEIIASIARKPGSIIERCVDEVNGVYAKTYYEVLERISKIKSLKFSEKYEEKNSINREKENIINNQETNNLINNKMEIKITVVKLRLETR